MVLTIKKDEYYDVIKEGYFLEGKTIKILKLFQRNNITYVKYYYLNDDLGTTSKELVYFLNSHLKKELVYFLNSHLKLNKAYNSKLYKVLNSD